MSDQEEVFATLVEIREEPTALYKILKIANVVSGGGEAKQAISEGYVSLNGEVETQKRKKIYAGDLIYFNEQYLHIAIVGETEGYEVVDETQLTTEYEASAQPNVNNKAPAPKTKKTRKPISF